KARFGLLTHTRCGGRASVNSTGEFTGALWHVLSSPGEHQVSAASSGYDHRLCSPCGRRETHFGFRKRADSVVVCAREERTIRVLSRRSSKLRDFRKRGADAGGPPLQCEPAQSDTVVLPRERFRVASCRAPGETCRLRIWFLTDEALVGPSRLRVAANGACPEEKCRTRLGAKRRLVGSVVPDRG